MDYVLVCLRLTLAQEGEDVVRLLRYGVVPYFTGEQINALRTLAKSAERSLREVIEQEEMLIEVGASEAQCRSVAAYVGLIRRHEGTARVSAVVAALCAIPDNVIVQVTEEDEKVGDIEDLPRELGGKTVETATTHVRHEIEYQDARRGDTGLVLTTIYYAKSQEFDTVFLLRADGLQEKRRLYVCVTGAKYRLYLVGNGNPP